MIAALLLSPASMVLASIVLGHVVWWLVGDLLLEHVGIPFLDAGSPREIERPQAVASDRHAPSARRPANGRRPSAHRDATARPATHERDRRRTGMSRDVRA